MPRSTCAKARIRASSPTLQHVGMPVPGTTVFNPHPAEEKNEESYLAYWILKTEPGDYSFEDLERDGRTPWDGVRNYQARNNLRLMAKGDLCFVYHSVGPREIVGIAQVTKVAYPDPTTDDDRWVCVDIRPVKRLEAPIHLGRIKEDGVLREMALVKNSRLSVSPVTERQWKRALAVAEE